MQGRRERECGMVRKSDVARGLRKRVEEKKKMEKYSREISRSIETECKEKSR